MRRKTVYPAHPIGGDVAGNLLKIKAIVRELHLGGTVQPVAPYIADCDGILDDNVPGERALGIASGHEYFLRGMIDQVWLYGPKISTGMHHEVLFAWDLGIPVIAKTSETTRDLLKMLIARDPYDMRKAVSAYLRRTGPIPLDDLRRWWWKQSPADAMVINKMIGERQLKYHGEGLIWAG